MRRIVLVGAGRVATQLAPALRQAGYDVVQVYSRTMQSAVQVAERVGAVAVDTLSQIVTDADVYIIAVKDAVLPQLLPQLCHGREGALFVHTAGSVPMEVFAGLAMRYGVMYPMQTFSKERPVDFRQTPLFIEGADAQSLTLIRQLAERLSANVREMSSAERRYLHLAAVFACNFVNHCYALSADILEAHGIPFSVMLPLIEETARKVHQLAPAQAQTGPAVRYDENIIEAQSRLLSDHPLMQDVYRLMSQSIHQKAISEK
ncbi:MAG: DUF2520 domain-containing protein [Prevotella sp.]|nr:DUF2520 domain-containing protein [Prevotella sp.]